MGVRFAELYPENRLTGPGRLAESGPGDKMVLSTHCGQSSQINADIRVSSDGRQTQSANTCSCNSLRTHPQPDSLRQAILKSNYGYQLFGILTLYR
jgi:hypothetical protein